MAFTNKDDVIRVFESTFKERVVIDDSLVFQWFLMAIDEFSVEIEPLNYDKSQDKFLYYDKENNLILLPRTFTLILGYTIKKYYCERQYDKIVKRTNIIGKDLKLNNTDADKKNARAELDYVNEKIFHYYQKLKPTALS